MKGDVVAAGRWPWLAVAAASLLAIGLIFQVLRPAGWTDAEPAATRTPAAEAAITAAAARIAEESAGTVAPTEVVAAPRVEAAEQPDAVPPAPPQGHSYVEFHGSMAKAVMAPGEGVERPRDDGPDWLGSPTAVDALVAQAREARRDWSFGWIRLSEQARADDLARALRGTGAEIVGAAGRLVRARLPGDETRLQAILALSEVDGLGTPPAAARMQGLTEDAPAYERVPVFVTLMAGDPDGRWRSALKDLGAEVGRFDPAIRVYAAVATPAVIQAIARADFVAAIEPVGVVEAAHDTAVPAMGVDALRTYQGSPGFFAGVGGAPVPIAVMDTGLNVNHLDIASNRGSVCGANFWYGDALVEDEDLWVDSDGHGTHVTGTIAGNGAVEPRYAGMAPSVRHIRFAKVLNRYGSGNDFSILRGMDFLGGSTACPESGWSADAVKPLIVNMSLSNTQRVWAGRSVAERKLDAVVWGRRQLYVVAQSNADIHGFANYGAAKNSLAVGAVLDSGQLARFSSHGPTADGRLAPQVVGTGMDLHSAAGDGSRGGYRKLSGTSMASPAVAGVAALLMEAVPAHRERPALARARLMASAIRPDAWVAAPEAFPADNSNGPGPLQMQYGLGKVSARTSVLDRDRPDGWTSASAVSVLEDGEYAYHDINVPQGASRLDVVLAWDEPPTDTLASAVLNDLDLWLDPGGDCEPEPCGEFASRSRVDNVEWIVVRNPEPGIYRAKVAATRVHGAAPRAALAWTVIRGASTPGLEIAVDRELVEVGNRGEERELTLSVTVDGYVAAGTRLHIDCRSVGGLRCRRESGPLRLTAEREDGIRQAVEARIGDSIDIGELAAGKTWEARIAFGNLGNGDADAFRLYFTASAWNGHAASTTVLTRTRATEGADVPEQATPANERFASATSIEGDRGTAELDLVGARSEPGEPTYLRRGWQVVLPPGSAWYEWTAPSDGMASFGVTPDAAYGAADTVRIDVFRGERIAALEPVAAADWGVQFFAESGSDYRIRVSQTAMGSPLVLHWSLGPRPANDDFAAAAVLEDGSGSVEGSNEGATLEPGEFFGDLAATVWYQWTAPSDGSWRFTSSVRDLRVLAFSGASVPELRLVSGFASAQAHFPARRGEVYRIAVASKDAEAAGETYELTWEQADRASGNDDFADAEEIPDSVTAHRVGIDDHATVEPGEPAESGIRTKWWVWTAASDGRYAWRFDALTWSSRLLVSVWTGDHLGELQLVTTNGARLSADFAFDAVEGTRYRISVGLPATDQWAYTSWASQSVNGTLVWGPAPENDDVSAAAALAGASGSVSGSNAFATGARGERLDVLGRSTLWWTYEAPASGWVRFAVDGDRSAWALTVHRESSDGLGGLEVIGASRWQRSDGEVLFEAREGDRYTIALGVRGGETGGEFTLRWEEADDPGWIRYAGRLADGDRDSRGNAVEIRGPGALAMDPGGTALYLASELGLQVFERNGTTGGLDYLQSLTALHHPGSSLVWDPGRERLLADSCGTWRAFGLRGAGPRLEDVGALAVADDPSNCGEHLLLGAEGSSLYRVGDGGIDHFAIEDDGTLRFVGTADGDFLRAVLSNEGNHLYAVSPEAVLVFERDPESGELTRVNFEASISAPPSGTVPLAITHDDAYLFVFDQNGQRPILFSLEDPSLPVRLAQLSHRGFWDASDESEHCKFARARAEGVTVDVFCPALAFVVSWDADAEALEGTDWIGERQADRFNGRPLPAFGAPRGFAASPDGRFMYVSTPRHGIVIIARGSPSGTDGTTNPSQTER